MTSPQGPHSQQPCTFYSIVLDGTGLSGTGCETLVQRRRPLLASYPQAGYTLHTETCGELARWWAPSETDPLGKRGYCTKHKNAVANPKPQRRRPSALDQYNKQMAASQAAAQQMAGRQMLNEIIRGSDK